MTTNNHPAHGPVSLDLLHQISEILSKASAQSDGGNLGYAMADAVKAIDELLSVRKMAAKEAVYQVLDDGSWTDYSKQQLEGLLESKPSTLFRVVYPSPGLTQPVLADEDDNFYSWFGREWEKYYQPNNYSLSAKKHLGAIAESAWFACRSAMLQAGNSPVTPDDVLRMDWLVSKTVDVREPMVYGSHSIFWSQTITDEDDDYHATKLREQIDAAMAAEQAAAPQQE